MYVKVLNNGLVMRRFQYKLGLNEDTKPLNKDPGCTEGLHFCEVRDVFRWVGLGETLAIVEIPEGEEIIKCKRKLKSHRIIIKEVMPLWNVETIEFLVKNGADVHMCNDYVLRLAAASGRLDVVKRLVEHGADVHAMDDCALECAKRCDQYEVVQYLESLD